MEQNCGLLLKELHSQLQRVVLNAFQSPRMKARCQCRSLKIAAGTMDSCWCNRGGTAVVCTLLDPLKVVAWTVLAGWQPGQPERGWLCCL